MNPLEYARDRHFKPMSPRRRPSPRCYTHRANRDEEHKGPPVGSAGLLIAALATLTFAALMLAIA